MTYVSKLHPHCEYLWQQCKEVKDIKDSDIWYKPLKNGPNPLSAYMSRVSHSADLSKTYTNHSICVTGTTLLGRYNFSSKQIMSVSGHRSVNSLAVYQKVSDEEKIVMGMVMNHYIQTDEVAQNPVINNNLPRPIAPKPSKPAAALGAPPPQKENLAIQNVNTHKPAQEKQHNITEVVAYEPEDPLLQADFNENFDFYVTSVLNEIETKCCNQPSRHQHIYQYYIAVPNLQKVYVINFMTFYKLNLFLI